MAAPRLAAPHASAPGSEATVPPSTESCVWRARDPYRGGVALDLPRIYSSLFHETEGISPRVLGVERSLAPRAHDDATCRCIVHVLARETVERLRTIERGLQVLDREVQRFCRRVWLTVRGDIQHL